MKPFVWDEKKNEWLKGNRRVSFEDVVLRAERGDVLDVVSPPNTQRYSGQNIIILEIAGYSYLVPYVENEREIFLKTIIPSRKATRKYLER